MSNTKKVTISLTPEQQEKARSLSKDLFGKENISGLVGFLHINKHINKITMANLNLNDSFINVRYDEVATIIRLTNKTAFLSCKSEYGTFEIKKSISNILNLIKTGQWELINTK